VHTSLLLPQPKGPFRVHENMRTKVVVMRIVPSSDLAALLRLANLGAPEAKAVVLELAVPAALLFNDAHFTAALGKARLRFRRPPARACAILCVGAYAAFAWRRLSAVRTVRV
jgi:hypothetical protein